MDADVVVIGGGMAGLAAAIDLSQAGAHVILVEKKRFLGGRVYSIRDRKSGDWVDNGQHALMGCYYRTFDLLNRLGTGDGVFLQPQLKVPYRNAEGLYDILHCNALPGPLHLLSGLLKMQSLSWREKYAALRFGLHVQKDHAVHDSETVRDVCERLNQPPALCKRMWDSITLSALNEEVDKADASLLQVVLKQAFFASAHDSRMGLPVVPLQRLHGDRAVRFIEDHGGQVIVGQSVKRLLHDSQSITKVVLSSGEEILCKACISAVPQQAANTLLQASGLRDRIPLPELGSSPIVSVYLWYDTPVSEEAFCCLQDCTYEWVFFRSNFMQAGEHKTFCACLVTSAARRLKGLTRSQLVQKAIEDLQNVYPEKAHLTPIHTLVFWEPRATFSCTPDHVKKRPDALTNMTNMFLAGDWTNTGLPATIEGAVASGYKAAESSKQTA